jgi:hypothetical protein
LRVLTPSLRILRYRRRRFTKNPLHPRSDRRQQLTLLTRKPSLLRYDAISRVDEGLSPIFRLRVLTPSLRILRYRRRRFTKNPQRPLIRLAEMG